MKKYELTDDVLNWCGHVLRRIRALVDVSENVREGDLGGFIESEDNLSHEDECWVHGDAIVCGNARLFGDAQVLGDAHVYGEAIVYGNAEISGYAMVYGASRVYDAAVVRDFACVRESAAVRGQAVVGESAQVYGQAIVDESAQVYGYAGICGDAYVRGSAVVRECAEIRGDANVCGDAVVCGASDFVVFKNWWSSGRSFTWTRSNNKWRVGCFYGTGDELVAKAYKDSALSGREYERVVKYVESILADEAKMEGEE